MSDAPKGLDGAYTRSFAAPDGKGGSSARKRAQIRGNELTQTGIAGGDVARLKCRQQTCRLRHAVREMILAVNFAVSASHSLARTHRREPRVELKQAASGWRERRENDLKEMGVVIPLSDWLGHNNGPDILENTLFKEWRWTQTRKAAFAPPNPETGARWARKTEELGLSYEEYRLELLERGRHPTDEDARRIRDARPITAAVTRV